MWLPRPAEPDPVAAGEEHQEGLPDKVGDMVLMLDGNLEMGAHVRCNLRYLRL